MFELSFSEIAVIAVVALLVLGPEKLPEVARFLGKWTAKARRIADEMKSELGREWRMEEWRREASRFEEEIHAAAAKSLSLPSAFPEAASGDDPLPIRPVNPEGK